MNEQLDDLITEAMSGKQMDRRTLFICQAFYDYLHNRTTEFVKENPEFTAPDSLLNAIKGACIIAALSRNEETDSPPDVIERIVTAVLGDTQEIRVAARDKMFLDAIANVKAGKYTEPYDGPAGSLPIPFEFPDDDRHPNPSDD